METVRPMSLPKRKNTLKIDLEDIYVKIPVERESKFQDQCEEQRYYLKMIGGDEHSAFYDSISFD